jgi:serine/threonine protein kinase/Tfp pilus assembly protein PilF
MAESDSIFGADLERLKRLLTVGDEELPADSEKPPAVTVAFDGLVERPGMEIGRYKLLSLLGEGGMGMVYLAEQQHPIRRQVALKIIKPGMDSKRVIARFEAEQQALALLEHPHIAHVYDAGLAPSGWPYFVMEHVRGIPITEHCDKSRLTIEERLRLFLHVCEAVQHAHQKGIIHRDLKPSNILVAIEDREAVPKVIDFGIARAVSQPLTQHTLFTEQGQLIGTPEYMSPEQADLSNQDIDTRTDIYSLGVVLYELLAGVLPFDPQTLREGGIDRIRKMICEEDPKTPSTRLSKTSVEDSTQFAHLRRTDVRTLRRKLSGDLDWITLKAMEKDRTRRYATVDALATNIRNHLSHQPVNAAPPGFLYRAGKFVRRHRQGIAVAGMAVVLLAGTVWAARTALRSAKEHNYVQSLEDEHTLAEAKNAFDSRNWDKAQAKVKPLLESPHVGGKARLLGAELLLEQQGPVAAIGRLQELLAEPNETAGQAHFLLANIYYETDPCGPGESAEHRRLWEKHRAQAEKLIAGTAQYYYLQAKAAGDGRQILAMLNKALEVDRQHYDSLRERACLYFAQRDCERTARDAARMVGIEPSNPQGYLLGGMALRELGRLDEALEDYAEATRLALDDPEPYDGRWPIYARTGRPDLALADLRKCVELRPSDMACGLKLSCMLTALGRYDEVQQRYNRLMGLPMMNAEYGNPTLPYGKAIYALVCLKAAQDAALSGRSWHAPGEAPRGPAYAAGGPQSDREGSQPSDLSQDPP